VYTLTILPLNKTVIINVQSCRKVYEDAVETNYFNDQ
jgi:hypothetical protein